VQVNEKKERQAEQAAAEAAQAAREEAALRQHYDRLQVEAHIERQHLAEVRSQAAAPAPAVLEEPPAPSHVMRQPVHQQTNHESLHLLLEEASTSTNAASSHRRHPRRGANRVIDASWLDHLPAASAGEEASDHHHQPQAPPTYFQPSPAARGGSCMQPPSAVSQQGSRLPPAPSTGHASQLARQRVGAMAAASGDTRSVAALELLHQLQDEQASANTGSEMLFCLGRAAPQLIGHLSITLHARQQS